MLNLWLHVSDADPGDDNDDDVTRVDIQRYRFNKRVLTAAGEATHPSEPEQINDERFRLSQFSSFREHYDDTKNATEFCGQAARQALMTRACRWMRDTNHPLTDAARLKSNVTLKMMLVDDEHKIIYCEVPKVACTSWKAFFANLSRNLTSAEQENLHWLVHHTDYHRRLGIKYLNQFSPDEREYRLKNYYKFMVVRNPYAKVISAWKDKFEPVHGDRNQWYRNNIGSYILEHYRGNLNNESLIKEGAATFEEFIKFIGNSNEDYIQRFDAHWWTMQNTCSPCVIQYDYIAKLETLQEDFHSIREHIAPGQQTPLPYLNVNAKSKAIAEQKNIERFVAKLSDVDVSMLNQAYNVDLKSFGYSMFDNSVECSLNYHKDDS